jgi:hypothetical protein
MVVAHEPFRIVVETRLFLPHCELWWGYSRNADRYPDTPIVYQLTEVASGLRQFIFKRRFPGARWSPSFKLFAPDGLVPGELLVVTHVCSTHARVRKAVPTTSILKAV